MEVEGVDTFLDNCEKYVHNALNEVSEGKQSRLVVYIDNLANLEDYCKKKKEGLKVENLKIKIDLTREFEGPLIGLNKEIFCKKIFNSARELLKSNYLNNKFRFHKALILCCILGIEKNIYSNWM